MSVLKISCSHFKCMNRMIANGPKPQYCRNICHMCPIYSVSEGLRIIWTIGSLHTSDPTCLYLTLGLSMTVAMLCFPLNCIFLSFVTWILPPKCHIHMLILTLKYFLLRRYIEQCFNMGSSIYPNEFCLSVNKILYK